MDEMDEGHWLLIVTKMQLVTNQITHGCTRDEELVLDYCLACEIQIFINTEFWILD